MPQSYLPEGYTAVTPYLFIDGCADAMAFYAKAFGATEVMRTTFPDGRIMHAEMEIGGARIMMTDANPDWGCASPKQLGGSAGSVYVYLEDVDTVFARAIAAGATETQPVTDMFWGDRMGGLTDPFGHKWGLATHVENVAPEDMARRQQAFMEEMAAGG